MTFWLYVSLSGERIQKDKATEATVFLFIAARYTAKFTYDLLSICIAIGRKDTEGQSDRGNRFFIYEQHNTRQNLLMTFCHYVSRLKSDN